MEPSGPFGAKSIAEIVIDAGRSAVRNGILDATGCDDRLDPIHARACLAGTSRLIDLVTGLGP